MRARAFAKINLSLRVLGTRPDGFHELRTLFQSIALHDTLTIRRRRGPFRLSCDDPRLPVDGRNLIVRAARAVWKAGGRRGAPRDLQIDLAKRIPLEAGLGGGSSDAAAALKALGRLWRVDAARLRAIAPALGADVAFFLEGGTALGLERGDVVLPQPDRPAAWVVLALPDFGVSTAEAYRWFDDDHGRPSFDRLRMSAFDRLRMSAFDRLRMSAFDRLRMSGLDRLRMSALDQRETSALDRRRTSALDRRRTSAFDRRRMSALDRLRMSGGRTPLALSLSKGELRNDLQRPVAKRHPRIARIVSALRRAGASHAAMSGSGSAVFGLFARRSDALRAAGELAPRLCPRTIVTRTLTRAACRRLAAK